MRAILLVVGMAALITIPGAGPATATDIQATPVGLRVGPFWFHHHHYRHYGYGRDLREACLRKEVLAEVGQGN